MKAIFLCSILVLCLFAGGREASAQIPNNLRHSDGWLEFDHNKHQNVDHGLFWKEETVYGKFFWESWVMPYEGSEFIISDGFGGRHNLLYGLLAAPTSARFFGNLWSYDANEAAFGHRVEFTATDTVPVNEWVHTAVSWDGKFIRTYLDGIVSGMTPFSGTRRTVYGGGSGHLYVGGSDHSNFNGRIARVRGFETDVPANLEYNFAPDLYFKGLYFSRIRGKSVTKAAFVADYAPLNLKNLTSVSPSKSVEGTVTKPTSAPPMPAIPRDSILFDSFSRQNQTRAFQRNVSLGASETGRFGAEKWTTGDSWGIFAGRAVAYAPGISYATVASNIASPNFKVSVDRLNYKYGATGVTLHYVDDANNLAAYTDDGSSVKIIERFNGNTVLLADCAVANSAWTTMSVEARVASLKIILDGKPVCTAPLRRYEKTQTVGLMKYTGTNIWRWDNFTVTELP